MPGLGPYDLDRQIKHVLGDFLVRNVAEIEFLVADLVGVTSSSSAMARLSLFLIIVRIGKRERIETTRFRVDS